MQKGYRFSVAVVQVVQSRQFLNRRNEVQVTEGE
jgi:hypothetical protein